MSNQDELFIESIALSLYLKDKINKFFETDNLNENQKNALLWATICLADNVTEINEISKEDFIEMYRGEDA